MSHPQALSEIQTRRLRLRPPVRRDTRPVHAAIEETLDDLVLWLPWAHPDYALSDTRHFLNVARRLRRRGESFDYVIESRETRAVLGMISLHRIDWVRQSAGLGYWVRRSAWRQGVGGEAALGVLNAGFRTFGLHRIEAHVAPENKISQQLVENLGMQREGLARGLESLNGEFTDHLQYAILGSDYRDAQK